MAANMAVTATLQERRPFVATLWLVDGDLLGATTCNRAQGVGKIGDA